MTTIAERKHTRNQCGPLDHCFFTFFTTMDTAKYLILFFANYEGTKKLTYLS